MAKKYTLCKCGTRNDQIGGRTKCVNPDCGAKLPKRRVPKHALTLRDDSYAVYCKANEDIHGIADEACGVCDKPRSQDRRHDRDHEHNRLSPFFGKPRGLACGGNRGCNVLMLPWITAATARGIFIAKDEAGEPDAKRWELISLYLYRCEVFYAREAVSA